jgi:IS1 family transposase
MRKDCISNFWLFPPATRELQLDEKWAFVYKKQKHCDLENIEDHTAGDCWDHVALDSEHRLVLEVVFGKHSATRILELLRRVKQRLGDRVPLLITSDEFAAYATVLQQVWPQIKRPRTDKRCTRRRRDVQQKTAAEPALRYATVCKEHEDGRVIAVHRNVVFGSKKSVAAALAESKVSSSINTSLIERHNATDRHRNARKQRRTYRFSKDWMIHQAVGYFSYYSYNFCWCVRTLSQKPHRKRAKRIARTPAMAAGLTDHPWALSEWLSHPVPLAS